MKTGIMYDSSEGEARILYEAIKTVADACSDEVAVIDVAEGNSAPCICCFKCWTKTPGTCVLSRDAGTAFPEKFWNADIVVIVSRITWGGHSVKVKSFLDRLIPILHPYFRKVNGEMHHQLRYDSFPLFLAAGFGARTEGEEATFLGITAANRDQGGFRRPNGTFIVRRGTTASSAVMACADWCKKELAL